ncbi:uncharacterized protein LOC128210255 [Mya arenaria]|uniref:uncharacterized protein LOC128210255 n=1 Tax=Mya arenaria TaxID=6604 RepID=UPI0022E58A85|nr:uncharacterized protein LOC128210255 [Mya arenaria]
MKMPKYIYSEYCFKICIICAVINCVSLSKASVIYSNCDQLSWRVSMNTCLHAGGTPVSEDVYSSYNVLLSSRQRVWTSDYTVGTKLYTNRTAELCGVRTYNSSTQTLSEEFFWNCDSHFLYRCCSSDKGHSGGNVGPGCIRNGTWEKAVTCSGQRYTAGTQDGTYWTGATLQTTQQQVQTKSDLPGEGTQIYNCGFINTDGKFTRTTSCYQNMSSLCSFGNFTDHSSHHMSVCNFTKTENVTRQDNSQSKAKQSDSKMVIGVAVGVGVSVALAVVIIGLIFMRRRGMICRPPTKDTQAHNNAAYGVTNGDISISLPALSTNDNAHYDNGEDNSQFHGNGSEHHINAKTNTAFPDNSSQHKHGQNGAIENDIQTENNGTASANQDDKHRRQQESEQANRVYSRFKKHIRKGKGNDSMATDGKKKIRARTACDSQRTTQGLTTNEYGIACFKDSTKLVQQNDYDYLHEDTDEYNTTSISNLHLHPGSEYNTIERRDDYSVANFGGNKTSQVTINEANDDVYNTLSTNKEDYNTVNLHRDNVPNTALHSDETYNTLHHETEDYNIVDLKGETNAHVKILHDDTYNTLGRGREEYNTVDFHKNTEANKSDDCYDHLH